MVQTPGLGERATTRASPVRQPEAGTLYTTGSFGQTWRFSSLPRIVPVESCLHAIDMPIPPSSRLAASSAPALLPAPGLTLHPRPPAGARQQTPRTPLQSRHSLFFAILLEWIAGAMPLLPECDYGPQFPSSCEQSMRIHS